MLVELRMRRQKRLTEAGFGGLTAVMTEAALRHQVGGRAIMRAQLEKLCQITEEGHAAVHVLPYEEGPWPGLGGFVIYSFPDQDDSEVVQVDGDLGAGIYEDREPISPLTYTFNAALAKALPARESLDRYRRRDQGIELVMKLHNPYHELPDELYEKLVNAPHPAPAASTGNGTCITVAEAGGYISFQDSKLGEDERQARTQVYTPAELAAFASDAKAGRYDHLI